MCAPVLLRARLTVCAPVPQPTSSTRLPDGNLVSPWSRPTTEAACASRRSLSRSPYPWMYTPGSSAGVTPASWTLLQPCCPTPHAGGEAELPRKHARHVTLIGETRRRRCRRESSAVTNQHPRTLGAAAQEPRVGRQPIGSLESAQNLIAAQPRELGQVCETGHSRRIVSEALAGLLEVRGWRIAPPRRAMPRHQAYTTCDQRFLECQGIHRSRGRLAIVPALETRKQTL